MTGMFLSDGGNIPFSAMSDQFTTNKWEALGFDSHSLWGIEASDFEVIDGGNRIALTYDCVRNDIELETCPRKLFLRILRKPDPLTVIAFSERSTELYFKLAPR
jgi:hypothetical protein